MNNKIVIKVSKKKVLLSLMGAILFVVLGLYFTFSPEQFMKDTQESTLVIRGIGLASTLFFGICAIFIIKKLLTTQQGLIIDENGIIDYSNATSIGLIEWNDITGFKIIEIASTKILIVKTSQPEKYIKKATNGISKRAMKANHKMYGSPLSIISNSLKINFIELEKLLSSELEKRKIKEQ